MGTRIAIPSSLALELREHETDRPGGSGRGGDDRNLRRRGRASGPCAGGRGALVVGVGVDRRHQPALEAEVPVQDLGDRGDAVGRAAGVREDVVRCGVVVSVFTPEDDRDVRILRRSRDDDLVRAGLEVRRGRLAGAKGPVASRTMSTPSSSHGSFDGSGSDRTRTGSPEMCRRSSSVRTSPGKIPWTESYLKRCASVSASVRSLTATNSRSSVFRPMAARRMSRPIRPNPLIATRAATACSSSVKTDAWARTVVRAHARRPLAVERDNLHGGRRIARRLERAPGASEAD